MEFWDAYVKFPPQEPGNVLVTVLKLPDDPEEAKKKMRETLRRILVGCATYYVKDRETGLLPQIAARAIVWLSRYLPNGEMNSAMI